MKKLMLGCGVLRSICAVGMMAFAVTAEAEWSKGGTGTETDPWNIGMEKATDVQAWTNGTGRLTITGTGKMMNLLLPRGQIRSRRLSWAMGSPPSATVLSIRATR